MLIATDKRVYFLVPTQGCSSPEIVLEGNTIHSLQEGKNLAVIVYDRSKLALLSNSKIQKIDSGIQEPIECLTLIEEEPLFLLIGTEAPHIYQFTDNGKPAMRIKSFDQLDVRELWYTPWGGPAAVRSLAHQGDWIYADIHVGSIMRSSDRGVSWEPVESSIHEDVHQVVTTPSAVSRVYANTANAVYISEDSGQSWEHRAKGLNTNYGRAIAVHPQDPDCLLASVSRGPGSNVDGQLFRSDNTGLSWAPVTSGFPESTRNNINTFQIIFSTDGTAWAAVNETLYKSDDRGNNWKIVWKASDEIIMLSCA